MKRQTLLENVLKIIINDFDQTGCSSGVGVVSTANINEARKLMGMDLLEDEVDNTLEAHRRYD